MREFCLLRLRVHKRPSSYVALLVFALQTAAKKSSPFVWRGFTVRATALLLALNGAAARCAAVAGLIANVIVPGGGTDLPPLT